MLQFHVELRSIERKVAHKLRAYIHLFVTLELVSDAEGFIPERAHVVSMNNKLIHLRGISAFILSASGTYPVKNSNELSVQFRGADA